MSLRLLRRLFAYVSLSVLALLILAIAGAGYLLHSQQGSRWLVDKAQLLAPGELQLGSIVGSLTGPLEVRDLVYRDGDLFFEVKRASLDWQPAALFEWRLHLTELSLEGSRLNLPVSEEKTEPSPAQPFSGVSLPLKLVVESLRIEDFQLLQPDGADPISLDHFILQAEAKQDQVQLIRLEADAFAAQLRVAGNLKLTQGLPLELKTDWAYRLPEGPELQGQGKISGNLNELHLEQKLAAPIAGMLEATLFELEKAPRWEFWLVLDKTDIGAFVDGFSARVSGRLQSSGTTQRVEADGQLDFFESSLGQLNLEFSSRYAEGLVAVEHLLVTTSNGMKVAGQGHYSLDNEPGTLAADLNWNGLRWPLIGEQVQFLSKDGSLSVDGSTSDYRYRLDLDAQTPAFPPALGRLNASGSGNLRGLAFDELSLVMQEGRIEGSGKAAWQPQPSWQMELTGEALNPGLFHADFPASLALALTSKGQIDGNVPEAQVVLQKLEGELKGYPVKATGEVLLDAGQLSFRSIEVLSGANQTSLEGTLGENVNLSWSIKAPELGILLPDLTGVLNAQGSLTGNAEMPRIQAKVDAREIVFKDNGIGDLQAKADLDLDGGQQVDLQLKAVRLTLGGQDWDELLLNAGGLRDNHTIEMQMTGDQVPQVKLGLVASLDKEYLWSGKLQKLALDLLEFGNWELQSPAGFSLDNASQVLDRACLRSAEAALCGSFKAQPDEGWKGALQATDIPFSTLQRWLPQQTWIAGRGNLVAEFAADTGGVMHGSANLDIPEGSLAFELEDERQNIDFSGGMVTASIDEKSGRSELNLPLAGLGGIQGDVILPGLQPMELNLESQAVKGQFKASIDDLSLLSVILPSLQNVRGAIAADFTLAGTVADPGLKGEAALRGGAVDIPELGLELRELILNVAANDLQRVTFNASVHSGDGNLKLTGETQLKGKQGFPTELQIKGENWLAVNIPEAEVHVSPDIAIKHHSERSELNGDVHIPYARIRPRGIPEGAVSGSSDLVVVGADSQSEPKTDPRFHSELRIIFGDRVSFEGLGLRANLVGNLVLVDEPGRPVTGRGRVGVVDGTYRAYGQDLKIERGYALFADSPVDNPGVDVRAVREVDEITAGLHVTGTLKKPELSLFSTPVMSESAVLSYLLTGRAPGESSGQNTAISTALQSAGVGGLSSEIGRQLGLDELRVDTGGTLAEASVAAGTYLSPRLYVQYVNELATNETKLQLRYDLTKRLQIQTETGRVQGVDLFYVIER